MFVRLVYCPDNFTYDSESSTCLQLATQPASWSESAAECHKLNERAHLVVINSGTKQLVVEQFMENHGEITQPVT